MAKIERDPLKVIYASSYDRGLEHLLDMWSDVCADVRAEIHKDPQLHIFYGWDLFDSIMGGNPERMAWKGKMEEKMKQPHIWHHGRVPHDELAVNFKTSSVWAYPTHFGEISCQVAMMAQVYGAIPCVVNYAALKETVQYGDRVDGDINDEQTKKKYKKALVSRISWCNRTPAEADRLRETMMNWAKDKFTWKKVAEDWNEQLL